MEQQPLSSIVSQYTIVVVFVAYSDSAAFNGVGVPGDKLPQDERIRLQFVSPTLLSFIGKSTNLFRDPG